MLKHCVLSVDYSESWEKTLDHLPATVRLLGLNRLTLVHVIETHKRQHIEDSEGVIEGRLKKLAEQLSAELNLTVDYRLRKGFAASELLDAARKVEANLVIALNRSHSSGRELFRGNIALNLARMTRIPLLILPMDSKVAEPDGAIMLATDGSTASQKAEKCFRSFMDGGNLGLVVWVDEGEADASGMLEALSSEYGSLSVQRLSGSPGKEIVEAARQEDVTLLILGKRGATPINELPLGSVAEHVCRESHNPVLLIP
ncbi:universal stress protein [Halopseudomonas sp.]|uniref:universal stress protein n=1 Tax=Halopseudomonas sp. TaxID=2901191 RepID=UPI0035670FC2